jgi:hypothetical protein
VQDRPPVGPLHEELATALHLTTIAAWKQRLADPGFDMMQAAHWVLVFTYHVWDEKYRDAIAQEKGILQKDVSVDVLGDMRLLRNSIIHNKGFAAPDVAQCKTIIRFKPGDKIELNKDDVNFIIRQLRIQLAKYA